MGARRSVFDGGCTVTVSRRPVTKAFRGENPRARSRSLKVSASLYRKYRPVRFEDVVGQDHVTRTLVNAIRTNRVSHAYLFAGPRGTGKTSTAKILAMALNCEAGQGRATMQPDGTCDRCRAIRHGSSMDVLEIDAASNRGIDEIREIRDKVHFAPVEGRMKVYIVDEVHMLTPEAFNALLKMLEEPPEHAVFVLATTEAHKVLPTILSRCQRFDFRRPSLSDIVGVLTRIAQAEGISVTDNTLSVIARAASGSFRDAIGTLDQLSAYCESTITMQDALALLGVAQHDLLFEIVDITLERDTKAALLFVERLSQTGTDYNQFIKDLLAHLRDLYILQHTEEPPATIGVSEEHLDGLRSQANRAHTSELVTFIDHLGEAQQAIRGGADPRLEIELLLIKLTQPVADMSLRAILSRLDRLEQGVARPRSRPPAGPNHTSPADKPPGSEPGGDRNAVPEAESTTDPSLTPQRAHTISPSDGSQEEAASRVHSSPRVEPDIDHLKRAWPHILNRLKNERPNLHAVLADGRPETLEGDTLVIRFPAGADFQVARISGAGNNALLVDEFTEITGRRLHITARVAGDDAPADTEEAESERILTGSELLEHLRREFGAKIVERRPAEDRDH